MQGRVSALRLAVVAAMGLFGFWIGNIAAQYLAAVMPALRLGADAAAVDLSGILSAIVRGGALGVSPEPIPMAAGAVCAVAVVAGAQMRKGPRVSSEIRPEEAHGSQGFASVESRRKYAHLSERRGWAKPEWCETVADDNLLLSANTQIAASKNPDYSIEQRCPNRHCFVMAGSGGGKTFTFVTPNVLQLLGSYVFTDPKGELFRTFARFLERHGYEVVILNFRDEAHMWESCRYNPLAYCDDMTSINNVVELFLQNTKGEDSTGDQMYFLNMERNFYVAIIGMFVYWFKANGNLRDCTLPAVIDYLLMAKDAGTDGVSNLDIVFHGDPSMPDFCGFEQYILSKYPDRGRAVLNDETVPEVAVLNSYEMFKSAAGDPETMSNVVSSCAARLGIFNNPAVRTLLSEDELDLRSMGKRKRALFLCTKDDKGAYDFISAMVLNQLFGQNIDIADAAPTGHLDIPVWCFLDELANIGKVPNLEKLFATVRSRWINLVAIVQNGKQLKKPYGEDAAEAIRSNSAIFVYLGGSLWSDCEEISKQMGTTTKVSKSFSRSDSKTGTSITESQQLHQVPLMRPEELFNYDEDAGKGFAPDAVLTHYARSNWLLDKKSDPTSHRRWPELQKVGPTDYFTWSRQRRASMRHASLRALPAPEGARVTEIDPDDPRTVIIDASGGS